VKKKANKMFLAPIVLFVYNRPAHTIQTLESLQKNELANESELFIYSDAPKDEAAILKVAEVRKYIRSLDGFKRVNIIEREKNLGLANSIIEGVTIIVNEYGKIIVLEDDLVTSPHFLMFMNEALEMYEDEQKVASIHGYIYPIDGLPATFFIRGADCWGWATWKRAWNIFEADAQKLFNILIEKKMQREADFNNSYGFTQLLKDQISGKINSWAVRWYMSVFLKNMLTLYVGKSLVKNIGIDGSGTHRDTSNILAVELSNEYNLKKLEAVENVEARESMENYFNSMNLSLWEKIKSRLRS
jgi:hypothetical protein